MQALSHSRLRRASFTLVALAAYGAASAATLESDFTVPTTNTTFDATPSVDMFNPALGTLLSVTFGLKDTMTTTISLSNQSSSVSQSILGTVNGSFTLKNTAGTTTYFSDSLTAQNGTGVDGYGKFAINPNNTPDYSSPYGHVFAAKTVSDSSFLTATASDTTTLNAFKGTGKFNFAFHATALGTTTSDNNNYLALYQTTAAANGYVIYTYAPVPEPASLSALAIGAVALLRRRKGGTR